MTDDDADSPGQLIRIGRGAQGEHDNKARTERNRNQSQKEYPSGIDGGNCAKDRTIVV